MATETTPELTEFWKLLEVHKFTLSIKVNKLVVCNQDLCQKMAPSYLKIYTQFG